MTAAMAIMTRYPIQLYLSGTCPNRKNPKIAEKMICE